MYRIKNQGASRNNPRTSKFQTLTWFFLIALLIVNLILASYSIDAKKKSKEDNLNPESFQKENGDMNARILELETTNREFYKRLDEMSQLVSFLEGEKKALEESCYSNSEQ